MKDGEVIAIHEFASAYAELGNEVHILAMNTSRHFTDIESIPKENKDKINYHAVSIDTSIRLSEILQNLWSNKAYHVERFTSVDFSKKLSSLLQEEAWDLIQCEGLYLGPYLNLIRKYHKGPVVIRAHNVESEIWFRIAQQSQTLKKLYLKIQAQRLREYEKSSLNQYDALLPISQKDASYYQQYCNRPLFTVPVGIDLHKLEHYDKSFRDNKRIGFIGSLDWMPNIQGLEWFIKNVWPQVKTKVPDAELHIAGRNPSDSILKWNGQNIQVLGEIEDQYEMMAECAVMIVPLFSGSGMRVKIIETMAMRKTVVSTSLGAEGIDCTHQENILLADSSSDFQEAIIHMLQEPKRNKAIAESAEKLIAAQYQSKNLVSKAIDYLQNNKVL